MADEPSLFRRIGPALLLIPLAPLIAEFLLGDFSIKSLFLVIVLGPMYGGGALLIREITRRTGRGWPTMLLLATAYALIEEAYTTQSLFNPNYVGARLLDYGYIPALGTSLNWTLFVLSIHVVWSVATPILIAEGIAAERRTTPWLKTPGMMVTAVLFLLGCAASTNFSLHASPFRASMTQFLVAGVFVAIAMIAAFIVKPSAGGAGTASVGTQAPAWWLVFAVTFVLATVFIVIESTGRGGRLTPVKSLVGQLACEVIAVVLIARWARSAGSGGGWNASHYLAIALGTTLTYALFGLYAFVLEGHTHLGTPTGTVDVVGQVVLAAVIVLLIGWGVRRSQRAGLGLDLRGALT